MKVVYINLTSIEYPVALVIDVFEEFPHLSKAPITEAVVEIRTEANVPWNEADIRTVLKEKLPEYPGVQSAHVQLNQVQFGPGAQPTVARKDLGWQGCVITTSDNLQIAKFQRQLFSFSRLQPYQDWPRFVGETIRLWGIYLELARPIVAQRIGLRFINRILAKREPFDIEEYFKVFPEDVRELGLAYAGFLHHDVLVVPGYPYAMNIIKTIQPPDPAGEGTAGLILDIDVYSQKPFDLKDDLIRNMLSEMHWLKNKVFFGIITKKVMEQQK